MIRLSPLLVLLPTLAGCHLFASGTIGTTCEDVEGGCAGDTGPITTGDDYVTRFVVGARGGGSAHVRVVDAEDGVLLEVVTDDSSDPGPVAWDGAGRVFYYDDASRVLHVLEATSGAVIPGEAPDTGATAIEVVDLEYLDGRLYALAPTALYRVEVDDRTISTLAREGSFLDAQSLFPTPDGAAWVLDLGGPDGLPDMWRVDLGSGGYEAIYGDFDDGQGRAHAGFLGPGDAPWVCSELGGMYAVEDLLGGSRTPTALPDAADMDALVGAAFVDDVTDCGWDVSASRYLAASVSAGVLGIDAWNNVDQVVAPVEGETPFRGAFAPEPTAR